MVRINFDQVKWSQEQVGLKKIQSSLKQVRLAQKELWYRKQKYLYLGTAEDMQTKNSVVRRLKPIAIGVHVNERLKGTKFWASSGRGGIIEFDIYLKVKL